MERRRVIVITGMKHTGKSTVGSLLAARMKSAFHDTDSVIVELCGKTPRELYDEGGPALMAERETEAVRSLSRRYAAPGSRCVIATGGGLSDNPEALAILKETGTLVWIDAPFETVFSRVMASARRDGRLPRFLQGGDPEALFRELFLRRTRTYATMADIHVEAGSKTPEAIVREIMDRTSE